MTRASAAATLALVALVLAAMPASGQRPLERSLIVRASGPSAPAYPVRSWLRSDAVVRLVAGDALTLLDGRGTRRLKGPGRFRLNRAGAESAGDLRRVTEILKGLMVAPSSRTRVGGVRGSKPNRNVAGTASDTLWFVDRARPGRYCLPAGSAGPGLPPGLHTVTLADGTVGSIEVVPVAIPDPAPGAVATVLLDKGCERQLDFLLERLAVADAR